MNTFHKLYGHFCAWSVSLISRASLCCDVPYQHVDYQVYLLLLLITITSQLTDANKIAAIMY